MSIKNVLFLFVNLLVPEIELLSSDGHLEFVLDIELIHKFSS
jgi:hypothetical protein